MSGVVDKLLETLNKQAKIEFKCNRCNRVFTSTSQNHFANEHICQGEIIEIKWISVETVTALLVEFFRENAIKMEQIKNEKDTKIEALQLAILTIYQPEIERLKKELNEANLLCELQGSRISGLETFKKQCKGKGMVDRKQLSDSLDRLAEDCHDKIIDELKFPAHHRHSGWAKVLQPIIWGWYEKLIHDCENGSGSGVK